MAFGPPTHGASDRPVRMAPLAPPMTALDAIPGRVITRDHAAAKDCPTRIQLPLKLLAEDGEPVEDIGDSLRAALGAYFRLLLHRRTPHAENVHDAELHMTPRR